MVAVLPIAAKPRISMTNIFDLNGRLSDQTINIGSIPKAQSAKQFIAAAV
jgi:hypothetical protein